MKGLDGEVKKAKTILKGHRIDLKRRSELAKEIRQIKSKNNVKRDKNAIITLNTILKKSKQRLLDIKRTKSHGKKNIKISVDKYKLLFVVRNLRSVESTKSYEVLKELGLLKMNTGRLFDNSEATLKTLDKILPFVYYGQPTLKHVKELLQKRGTIYTLDNKCTLISNNILIEDNFSQYGIYSISDLADIVYNGCDDISDILNKLGPIKLSRGELIERFGENVKEYGNINDNINEKILNML